MVRPAAFPDAVRSSARHGGWAERVARSGLVARGVVYLLLGVVAFRLAWGDRSETADKGGALELLQQQPLGDALLALLAIGLACYAIWCLVEAVLEQGDAGEDGTKDAAKAWAKRAGYLGRAAVYGAAFVTAISILRHQPGAGGSADERSVTASVLGWGAPGQIVVGAVGIGFVLAGAWNAYRALTTEFEDDLRVDSGPAVRRSVRVIGIAGLLGRAVAFAAIGWFVTDAAIRADATRPLGLDESLATLAAGPAGPVGLSIVALGLILFGLLSVAEARWKQLET